MKIAIVGLGKMGHQMVEKLASNGIEVIAFDSNPAAVSEATTSGAIGASSREDVISKFGNDTVVVWLMIPSSVMDGEISEWQKILKPGSVLIDGGNSNFEDSVKRSEVLSSTQISFVDVGTSGGVMGATNGFSLMIGGNKAVVDSLDSVFKILASPNGSYSYIGASGSGHFVKMVHNAIEYGYMESLAEGYRLLAEGPFQNLDLPAIAEVWQHGSIVESKLNELVGSILKDNRSLEGIDGVVEATGEANWAIEFGKKQNVEMPAIAASLNVRAESQAGKTSFATKLLAALRNKFGGHSTNPK